MLPLATPQVEKIPTADDFRNACSLIKTHFLPNVNSTVRQLAKAANLPRARVGDILDGRKRPTLDEMHAINGALTTLQANYEWQKFRATHQSITTALAADAALDEEEGADDALVDGADDATEALQPEEGAPSVASDDPM